MYPIRRLSRSFARAGSDQPQLPTVIEDPPTNHAFQCRIISSQNDRETKTNPTNHNHTTKHPAAKNAVPRERFKVTRSNPHHSPNPSLVSKRLEGPLPERIQVHQEVDAKNPPLPRSMKSVVTLREGIYRRLVNHEIHEIHETKLRRIFRVFSVFRG